jgi:flagellar biosynthesis repressor protein FlbT
MALKLSLKVNERMIAGGAVIRNTTGKAIQVSVENEVPVLREKEILSESRADTPCKRVYLVVQLMYIDETNIAKYQKIYWELARDIIKAAPSTSAFFERISGSMYKRSYYEALKETRKLMVYEERMTRNARTTG